MNIKKFVVIFVTAFLAFASINLGIYFGKMSHMTALDDDIANLLDKPPMEGKLNMLLLGVDEGGQRSDTIMLVNVDNVQK